MRPVVFFVLQIKHIRPIPNIAATIAPMVSGQKYFLIILFAVSWNRHSKNPTIINRPVRNIADTLINNQNGKPIKPAVIHINLYGIGVTAVKTIKNIPCLMNILCAR